MKGPTRKTALVVIAVLVAIAVAAALVACQAQSADSGDGSSAGPEARDLAFSESGTSGSSDSQVEEEWPGQSLGYVGPNGEGVLDPDDFETEEAYQEAAISAAQKEYDASFEVVQVEGAPDYVRGKVWLDFAEGCSELRAREIVSEAGGLWVSSTYKWGSRSVETYFPAAEEANEISELCAQLMELPDVSAAYPEFIETSGDLHYTVNDTAVSDQDYLSAAGFDDAWDVVRSQKSVSIAFLDTGVSRLHEDLNDNVLGGYDAYNCIRLNMSDCEDTYGHGTEVAGVACAVAGNGKGHAGSSYNAVLKAIRVTSSGDSIDVSAVKRGLEYLLYIDTPDVVNMSFGLGSLEAELPPALLLRARFQSVLDDLHDEGVVIVASVGNDSNTVVHYPAKFDNVIGVGSVELSRAHSAFSNSNDTVDICAYGSGVASTANSLYNPYVDYTDGLLGTSFAAPQVAAAAALLKAQDPSRSADDIEGILTRHAVHPSDFVDDEGGGPSGDGPDGKDDQGRYGYGVLDVAAAVGWTASGGSPNTGGSVAEMYMGSRR